MAGIAPPLQGVAQPAIVQPGPAALPMPLTIKPRTFRQFYEDASKDPCLGDYTRIMTCFDPEAAPVFASDVLMEQALGTRHDLHQAYLCCAATHRGPRIYCIHLPSRFTSALDGRVTPWDNNLYAFLGEVTQDVATTVCFPGNAFTTVANILAHSEDYIQANIQGLNGIDIFPQQGAVNNHTSMVSTCHLMYLPSRYVPLLLDSSGYTIKQVWQILPPVLAQNQDTVNCQALLKWLRVASHGTNIQNAQGQPVMGPPSITIPLLSPVADRDLILHRSLILKQALPGIGQPAEGLEVALLQMANAVVAQTNDQRLAREVKANEAALPTLPSAKFKNTLPILMEFVQVQDETDLPLLWHQWANSNKRQEFSVLRELLDTYSRSVEAFYNMSPVVSAKLVQD
jgi:hypothetical protein